MSAYGYSANFKFNLINFNTPVWQTEEHNNWRMLDGILSDAIGTAAVIFGVDSGTANARVVTNTPAQTVYTAGKFYNFISASANTGATTIDIDGLGVKNIIKNGAALIAGDIPNGTYVKLVYNGTAFELIEPRVVQATIADASITPAKLTTGHPTWDASGNLDADGTVNADGQITAASFEETGGNRVISHNDNTFNSGRVFFSTSDPTGGANGDIWFKYTA